MKIQNTTEQAPMAELTPKPFKPSPTNASAEVRALDGQMTLTNRIQAESKGAEPPAPVLTPVPSPIVQGPKQPVADALDVVEVEPAPEAKPFVPVVAAPLAIGSGKNIFFTGRLCAGKDYLATQAQRTIIGLADPLYYLATHFFGVAVDANTGKDSFPGMRQFLQVVGQWGAARVDIKYPLTTERAIFCTMIRSLAAANIITGHSVDWSSYGKDEDIWLKAAIKRAADIPNAAITNVRFKNEFARLKADNWQHWHCMTTPTSWTRRLAERKLTPQSAEVNDLSEQLAASLDAQVQKKVSQQKTGPKLHVVWNDPTPPPSSRFYTLAEFLKEVAL